MTANKIIFLDIDGCLNSVRSAVALGGYPHSFKPSCMKKFDKVAIGLVRWIVTQTGAKIVISSTWRRSRLWSDIGDGLKLPVIGSTPVLNTKRGEEIELWLRNHPEVTEYAIIDDDSDMLESQLTRLVHVDNQVGLSYADACQAVKTLGVIKT